MSKKDIELEEFLIPSTPNQGEHLHEINPFESTKDWRESNLLKCQIIACFFLFIIAGICDQTVGTLMPYIVEHFNTTQTTVSVVFMLQFLGYSISALSNEKLHFHYGRIGVMSVAVLCFVLPFLTISLFEVLWLLIVLHFLYGLGMGLLDSCINVFLSSLVDHNELMGLLHGFYGVGSVISPPLVSLILQMYGYRVHYGLLTVLSLIGFILVFLLFRGETKEKYHYEIKQEENQEEVGVLSLLKDPSILTFCGYLFLYIGAELSIGSWLLTYLRTIKSMEQLEASYVVSWFWIGLTCGRMLLGFVTKRFKNEYRANLWYSILSWLAFSVFMVFSMMYQGNHYGWLSKIFVFISGVFIGPLFPTSNVTLLKVLPVQLQVSGVGLVTSLGGTGSALIPFSIGSLSRWMGFEKLPLLINFVILGYCILWVLVPRFATRVRYEW
jgi:fucose permease